MYICTILPAYLTTLGAIRPRRQIAFQVTQLCQYISVCKSWQMTRKAFYTCPTHIRPWLNKSPHSNAPNENSFLIQSTVGIRIIKSIKPMVSYLSPWIHTRNEFLSNMQDNCMPKPNKMYGNEQIQKVQLTKQKSFWNSQIVSKNIQNTFAVHIYSDHLRPR